MSSLSPAYLLLAAVICSMVGRALLLRAAWEISKPWGFAVLCVPLAPMFFRMNYKELAGEGQNWRIATTIFAVAFFAVTGCSGSLGDLWQVVPGKLRPAQYAAHETPEKPETSAAAEEPEESVEPESAALAPHPAMAKLAPALAQPTLLGRVAAILKSKNAAPAPAPTTPAPQAALTIATLTPPLIIPPTLAERVAANQAEFARLGEVYETLKKEKGYLRKGDHEAVAAYNTGAAQYQAALAAARAEQVELNKQRTVAKK
jgi:hypothetical protein